jgi:hypothetical protein
MTDDDGDSERKDGLRRQANQRRHQQHADADRPDHLHERHRRPPVEAKTYDGHFQQDQPQPARQQESAQLRRRLAVGSLQKNSNTGKKHERRRTQVRDPTSHEQDRRSLRQVGRVKSESLFMQIIAQVIQHHHRDHEATQQVDRIDTQRTRTRQRNLLCGANGGRVVLAPDVF